MAAAKTKAGASAVAATLRERIDLAAARNCAAFHRLWRRRRSHGRRGPPSLSWQHIATPWAVAAATLSNTAAKLVRRAVAHCVTVSPGDDLGRRRHPSYRSGNSSHSRNLNRHSSQLRRHLPLRRDLERCRPRPWPLATATQATGWDSPAISARPETARSTGERSIAPMSRSHDGQHGSTPAHLDGLFGVDRRPPQAGVLGL